MNADHLFRTAGVSPADLVAELDRFLHQRFQRVAQERLGAFRPIHALPAPQDIGRRVIGASVQ